MKHRLHGVVIERLIAILEWPLNAFQLSKEWFSTRKDLLPVGRLIKIGPKVNNLTDFEM